MSLQLLYICVIGTTLYFMTGVESASETSRALRIPQTTDMFKYIRLLCKFCVQEFHGWAARHRQQVTNSKHSPRIGIMLYACVQNF